MMSLSKLIRRFSLLCLTTYIMAFSTYCFSLDRHSDSTYNEWYKVCYPTQNKHFPTCIANRLVTTTGNHEQVVLGVMVGVNDFPFIILRFTAGADNTKGAALKIDKQPYFKVRISSCDQKICEVRAQLTPEFITAMIKGSLMQFSFFLDEQQIIYPIGLIGFQSIYTNL